MSPRAHQHVPCCPHARAGPSSSTSSARLPNILQDGHLEELNRYVLDRDIMYLCLIMNVYISISCTCVYTKGSTSNNNNNHPTYPTHSAQQEHKRQLEALQAELQARTEAFDLYRARSHTTLKKVAAGQRGAEDRVVGVQVSVGRVCVCFFFLVFFWFFFWVFPGWLGLWGIRR